MEKKRKIIVCISLAVLLIAGICIGTMIGPKSIELPEVVDLSTAVEPDDFYNEFQLYVNNSELNNGNYIVSPLSFRQSMMTITEKTEGNEQKKLLNKMGFSTIEEYEKWNRELLQFAKDFNNKEQNKQEDLSIDIGKAYIKDLWQKQFTYLPSYEDSFFTESGKEIKKDYMKSASYYDYYKDKETELVSVPLTSNMSIAFVVGNIANIYDKIDNSIQQKVSLTIPKFSVSSQIDNDFFKNYLNNFDIETENLKIEDIKQLLQVDINETGIGTKPATIIMGGNTTASKEYINFTIDKPYYFIVYNQDKSGEYNTFLFGCIYE